MVDTDHLLLNQIILEGEQTHVRIETTLATEGMITTDLEDEAEMVHKILRNRTPLTDQDPTHVRAAHQLLQRHKRRSHLAGTTKLDHARTEINANSSIEK